MSRNANAPFWVRASIVVLLVVGIVPAWLYIAGRVFTLIAFRGDDVVVRDLSTWIDYFVTYRNVPAVKAPLLLGAAAASVVCLSPFILLMTKRRRSLHGEARFATTGDMYRAGLLTNDGDGIILGRHGRSFLTAGLKEHPHVMLAAPTGSGKGVGVVIPNLLNWDHSVIVLDIKRENWELTAGFRKAHGHDVFLFDPASPERKTHRWNPLFYISTDAAIRIDDIQKIGNILFPDVAGADPIWTASCRSLFLGLVLYLVESDDRPCTLGQVAREAYAGNDMRFSSIIEARREAGRPLSAACVSALVDYMNTAEATRTSIRKTFTSRFELFLNPIVDAATAGNDFDLRLLRKTRMSIYLGITPDNLSRMAPLLNLFFQQVVDLNTRELPEKNPELCRQCLLILDEFRALGKLPLLVEAIAFLRGYGLRLLPIFQSPSQVREVYGEDAARAFFQNHAVRISYTPADMDAAAEISKELGNVGMKASSVSRSRTLGSKGSHSVSDSEQARALLLPQEVREIGEDEELVFARGCHPVRARKIRWYSDPVFRGRVQDPPHVPVAQQVHAVSAEAVRVTTAPIVVPADVTEEEAAALADHLYMQMMAPG
jgi:type IV secretion system protein VirD4